MSSIGRVLKTARMKDSDSVVGNAGVPGCASVLGPIFCMPLNLISHVMSFLGQRTGIRIRQLCIQLRHCRPNFHRFFCRTQFCLTSLCHLVTLVNLRDLHIHVPLAITPADLHKLSNLTTLCFANVGSDSLPTCVTWLANLPSLKRLTVKFPDADNVFSATSLEAGSQVEQFEVNLPQLQFLDVSGFKWLLLLVLRSAYKTLQHVQHYPTARKNRSWYLIGPDDAILQVLGQCVQLQSLELAIRPECNFLSLRGLVALKTCKFSISGSAIVNQSLNFQDLPATHLNLALLTLWSCNSLTLPINLTDFTWASYRLTAGSFTKEVARTLVELHCTPGCLELNELYECHRLQRLSIYGERSRTLRLDKCASLSQLRRLEFYMKVQPDLIQITEPNPLIQELVFRGVADPAETIEWSRQWFPAVSKFSYGDGPKLKFIMLDPLSEKLK
jgi:hypothetical protein